jgi:hypothetical protein
MGSRVVAEVHYRGASEPVVDRGTLGLFFAEQQANRASELVLEATTSGPPGRLRAATRLASDTHVWAMKPDIGAGFESIEISARTPGGRTEVLLYARDLRAEWPTPFILKEPKLLRRGTELSLVARTGASRSTVRPRNMRLTIGRYQATR